MQSALSESKVVIPAGVSHPKLRDPSKKDHLENAPHPKISEFQSKSLQSNTYTKLSEKSITILQQLRKSVTPNVNFLTEQSSQTKTNSSYLDIANAIVKDAQALNSRVEKLTKNANTVKSIIDKLESFSKIENMDLSPNSNALKKSGFWITTAPGLYFLIMEQLPKLLFHSDDTGDN